jgi:hypothetical protein
MSVASLSYDEKRNEYIVDVRMFIDDFMVATDSSLDRSSNIDLTLLKPRKSDVRDYVSSQISIVINGQIQTLVFEKMKIEELTVLAIFRIKSDITPSEINRIDVTDTILVDEFINQRNICHIEIPGKKRKSLLFNQYYRENEIIY